MSNSRSYLHALAATLLGATALALVLPQSEAQAACSIITPPPPTVVVGCTGSTTVVLPISSIATSGTVILGSNGNPASVAIPAATAVQITGTGAGTTLSLESGNLGAPSSVIGSPNGVSLATTAGGNISIGQASVGGAGLNANITGQTANGIFASASLFGAVNITTAPGTLVSGAQEAIRVNVVDGPANLVFNGNVATTNAPAFYDISVSSSNAGPINISGSGNAAAGGIIATSLGPGSITITGSGNTTDLANGPGILATASGGNVTIARGGFVVGALDGIAASTAGAGNVTVTTSGDVTGNNGFGVRTAVGAGGIATINVGAGSTISGSAGPLGVTGTTIINNAGTLNFANGAISNTVLNTTTLNGAGGRLAIDVNTGAGAADKLTVTNLSGTTGIVVQPIGAAGLISSPIPILAATTVAPGTTVTPANNPGIINYAIQQSGNTFNLVSTVNTSVVSATPTSIDAVLTALNTGFFQNASAFISEPPNPEKNQWNGGPWIRVAGGQNDVNSTSSAQNPSGTAQAPNKIRASFDGFQTGIDLGVANVEGTGWNTHLGVTAGQVNIRTNDLLGSSVNSQTEVPYIGIYGAVTGHDFFADFQVREDFYNLTLNNPLAQLQGAKLVGTALAANGSVGYRLNLPSSWFIESSAAFIYSDLHMDSLRIGLGGASAAYLVFNPFPSDLGRIGVRVGTTYVLDSVQLALQPFATGSLWREFAGPTQSTFVLGQSSVPLSVTRLGTFAQFGAGVSGQVLNSGFLGFVRADYRVGDNISGYALVAGLRYQF
jgi:hypothetical protein